MSDDSRIWYLDEADVAPTIAKLNKINERARSHGLEGRYTCRLGEVTRQPVYLDGGYDAEAPLDPHARPDHYKVTQELIVEGVAPKIAGWSFLATLSWDGGVLVTGTVPGFDGRIEPGSVQDQWCGHCRTRRERCDTYLVQAQDGERKQVGSACIKDFLGHAFQPSWVASRGSELDDMEQSFGQRVTEEATVDSVLAWAASLTASHGWVSRDKAEIEYRESSSSVLRGLLFGRSKADREGRQELQPADDHKATAARVRDWARTADVSDSEYLANVQHLAESEYVRPRNAGILGSAVASYHREMNAQAEREARPVSQWAGQPKDKLELDVTVRGDTAIDGDWGVTHLYTLVSDDGNVFKWFSSRNLELAPDQHIRITGTVKGHEEYREVRQTLLTRCKIAEPQPEPRAQPELEAAS